MGFYSTTETEDTIIREHDEKTGAPGIVLRLPKYVLSPDDRMRMYLTALERLHHDAETRRRMCLKEGDDRGYFLVDTLEKEAEAQLWNHFFPEIETY